MADNTIQIAFEAIDKNVKKTVAELDAVITGLKKADVPASLQDSTFGETDQKTKEFLEGMRAQFAEASGAITEAKENFSDFEENTIGGSIKAAAAIGVVVAAVSWVASEMNKIVELSKEQPELFTPQQLGNITAYGEEVSQLKEQLTKTKIEIASGIAPALTTFLERSNAAERAMNLAAAAGENWAFISEQQKTAFIEQAIALEDAIDETESYDRAMLISAESAGISRKAQEDLTVSDKERAAALKETTKDNENYLNSVANITKEYETYQEKIAAVTEDEKLSIEERQAKIDEYTEEFELNSKRRILAGIEERLAKDGLSDEKTAMLEDLGIKWGVYTQEAIDQKRREADEIAIEAKRIDDALHGIKDRTITVTVNATGSGLNLLESSDGTRARVGVKDKRAGGGPVTAGDSYLVGERGPELFSPGTSGNVTPNDQLGGIDYDKLARTIVQAMQKGSQ
jgi:hypothetical protein